MSVRIVREFGPYLKNTKQNQKTTTKKPRKHFLVKFPSTELQHHHWMLTYCKWLGTAGAIRTIFVGIHFPKRIPLWY